MVFWLRPLLIFPFQPSAPSFPPSRATSIGRRLQGHLFVTAAKLLDYTVFRKLWRNLTNEDMALLGLYVKHKKRIIPNL